VTNKSSIKLVQISDIHLFANKKDTLLAVNTFENFMAVLTLLENQQINPDLIVLSGDLSHDGSEQSYQHLLAAMKTFTCPIAWVPGNHDLTNSINSTLNASYFNAKKQFIFSQWQIILLDSHQDNQVSGFLTNEQLQFLTTSLRTTNLATVIMLHHQVLPVGSAWVDRLNVQNKQEFLQIIDAFPQVKAVVCGHVHQDSSQSRNEVLFLSTPATALQFKPHSDNFKLDTQMPGFRLIELHENGKITSTVHRVPYHEDHVPDLKSVGY